MFYLLLSCVIWLPLLRYVICDTLDFEASLLFVSPKQKHIVIV